MKPNGIEITPEGARVLWSKIPIFAYDESQEVDWQINSDDTTMEQLDIVIKEGHVLFIEDIKLKTL